MVYFQALSKFQCCSSLLYRCVKGKKKSYSFKGLAAVILLCTPGIHMLHTLIEVFEFAQIHDLSATSVSEEPNQM